MRWTVYILRCADETLYTGITNNLPERLIKHDKGTGAKYMRGRSPFKVAYTEQHATKNHALTREVAIKKMRKAEKIRLCLDQQIKF